MMPHKNHQNIAFEWVALGLVALLLAGCSFMESRSVPEPAVVETPPPAPPEPSLVATGDAQLTLFGEFPDRSRVPFQARAASPMEQHSFTAEGADFDADLAPDGQWVAFSSTRHTNQPDIYLKQVNGRAVTQLTSDPAADVQPCYSPDGKWIAFASNRAGNWDLWIKGLDGGPARQITRSAMHEVHPSFSPEGKQLAYCMFNDRAGQWELWTLHLDRPGSKQMIGVGLFPEWSPVTDSIVYQRARQRGGRWFSIWRVDLEGGEPKFPIELAASSNMAYIQPSWSPDGQWIAYGTALLNEPVRQAAPVAEKANDADKPTSPEPAADLPVMSRGDIWIMRADGTSPLQLTDGGGAHFSPVWSVDQRVFFTSLQNGVENVWSVKPLLGPTPDGPTAQVTPSVTPANMEVSVPVEETANQGG